MLLSLAALIVLIAIGSFFVDEPIRRGIEQQMNRKLKGYTARLHAVSFHPLGFSLTLYDLEFTQDAYPEPALLRIPRLDASVQWKALLFGRVVANFELDRPQFYADRAHAEAEAKDPTPVTEHGWQEAFEQIYPLKINHVRIHDGEITYVDRGQAKPLRMSHVNVVAENIRNVRSRERTYPSDLHLEGRIFETGKIAINGNADFLAEPYAGIKADLRLEGVELDYARPVLERYGVVLKKGALTANGRIEYAPSIKLVELTQATIRDVSLEYIHTEKHAGAVQTATHQTVESAKQTANQPDLFLRIKDLSLINGDIAITNKATSHPYRVFLSHADLAVQNFSNQRSEGIGTVRLRGKFMNSGDTVAMVAFQPDNKGPNFDVDVKVEHTDLTTMNDVLRAHGKFDVASGRVSVYSQMKVEDGRVVGYVKPLFRDVRVSAPETKGEKNVGQKIKEKALGAAFKALKNIPRREVATKADISGPLEQPQTDKWQILGQLLKNAFYKSILPGFDQQVAAGPVRRDSREEMAPKKTPGRSG
jgi:Domain of Unknown Function (DUF748)